jgi:hypothetical protein
MHGHAGKVALHQANMFVIKYDIRTFCTWYLCMRGSLIKGTHVA